ncbi:phospholipid/cholesterol/gamma-HCH transport system substrate-binding protein [Aeromicrobium panaciterrae]|uniref:Phospholipid/cholesterol/gamma-HCH transport system substrate-binding protein n=1 Tax=Aeromicrobium panaciterrae TaxID=363861 RepID=A0ABU1UQ72_9ACTN|nr:MCE family protein [Aeromicrobium panaciterrae]MDR7087326.1 phospholipid/cholesterol/gamma-HCH transport system substrate-binding protein [Aeromicrobium panaciterrae]
MKNFSTRQIGIAGVVGTVIMGLFVLALSVIPFGQKHYSALMEHSAGLRVGEEVQVAGVGVGEVRDIKLEGKHVRVEFTLDKDIELGSQSRAAVKVATLLGTHFLDVTAKKGGDLKDDTIPLAQTSVPYNLQDVIDGGSGALNALDGEAISDSMTVLAEALRGTPVAAREAIDGVARLTEVAGKRSDQMRALLAATNDVTDDLVRNKERIIDLLEQSSLVLHELTSRRDAIDQLLTDSQRLARAVIGVLDDTEKDFTPLMRDLTKALDTMKSQKKSLTQSIDGLATMATYFANATGNGRWLDLKVPAPLGDNLTCAARGPAC